MIVLVCGRDPESYRHDIKKCGRFQICAMGTQIVPDMELEFVGPDGGIVSDDIRDCASEIALAAETEE